jgi:hypothetical protein
MGGANRQRAGIVVLISARRSTVTRLPAIKFTAGTCAVSTTGKALSRLPQGRAQGPSEMTRPPAPNR